MSSRIRFKKHLPPRTLRISQRYAEEHYGRKEFHPGICPSQMRWNALREMLFSIGNISRQGTNIAEGAKKKVKLRQYRFTLKICFRIAIRSSLRENPDAKSA